MSSENRMELARRLLVGLCAKLSESGLPPNELHAVLLSVAVEHKVLLDGNEATASLLGCIINDIEAGAYAPEYVAPEAIEHGRERLVLRVIEGGGGSKV